MKNIQRRQILRISLNTMKEYYEHLSRNPIQRVTAEIISWLQSWSKMLNVIAHSPSAKPLTALTTSVEAEIVSPAFYLQALKLLKSVCFFLKKKEIHWKRWRNSRPLPQRWNRKMQFKRKKKLYLVFSSSVFSFFVKRIPFFFLKEKKKQQESLIITAQHEL